MIVGLTGGIGSGKTIVSKIFETLGCVIYNSDEVAKQLYFDELIKPKIISLLGSEVYSSSNQINKDVIAKKIFSNPELLNALNAIIHPAVKIHFESFCKKNSTKIIIKETAILFEIGIEKQMDYIILVTAPTELKIKRVMKRNSISKAEVEKRISNQWSDEQKMALADFCINNNEKIALIPQVLKIHSELTKL